MKNILAMALLAAILSGCSDQKGRYVDLRTGETIDVEKDSTGAWINAETRKLVYLYVDTRTNDTIYGRTGAKVNGRVVKKNNTYWFVDDDEYKVKYDDGEIKVKDDDYKKKVDDDGDIKIKDGDKKIKIDGETGERKVKED